MPLSVIAPAEVYFQDTSSGDFTSWLWTFGDGSTSTDQNPSHTYTVAGVYVVTLTATNAEQSVTFSDLVTVGSEESAFSQPDPSQQECPGADPQVMLRISNDGGKTFISEQWRSAGRVGEYDHRVRWNRLGQARKRVFEVIVTDPNAWRITGAYVEATETE